MDHSTPASFHAPPAEALQAPAEEHLYVARGAAVAASRLAELL